MSGYRFCANDILLLRLNKEQEDRIETIDDDLLVCVFSSLVRTADERWNAEDSMDRLEFVHDVRIDFYENTYFVDHVSFDPIEQTDSDD